MDEGTIIAVVSLIISILSTLVCLGQIIQQYLGSGQSIRLCDSIVYGGKTGLPGRGRRLWIWRQFRYRIIYEIPQISLVPLPPTVGMFVPYLIKPSPSFDWPPPEYKLMSNLRNFDCANAVGEASWVSFCRVLFQACPASVIVNRVSGDADRCPSDMTNIPMPISLRDISIFCLFIGMECSSASFSAGSIAMSGPVGSITSSAHPTLGTCVHFALPQDGFRLSKLGSKIDTSWILRACGRLRVGSVILMLGTRQQASSGLRSPFEDQSSDDWNTDITEKPQIPKSFSDEIKVVTIPSLDFYWMSQISVVAGFWATPFKPSANANAAHYWGGQEVIIKAFSELFYRDSPSETYTLGYSSPDTIPDILCGANIVTYPPYGLRHAVTGEMMSRDTVHLFASKHEYVECPQFGCHIPKVLIRKESSSPTAHARLDDHYLCTAEVMAIDVWLCVVSKTVPIMAGRQQILPRIPSIMQDLAGNKDWEDASYGSRGDVERCAGSLRQRLAEMQLSEAEKLFLLISMLRTVKVGLCLALGNDSSPLLEIIEKDVQAHMF